jgi:hypothetical protein
LEVGWHKHRFIVGLSLTARKFDSIWVVVDSLTKSNHFILVNTNYNVEKYLEIYIARVLCLHGLNYGNLLVGVVPKLSSSLAV